MLRCATVLAILCATVMAQATSSLRGVIYDAAGAIIPGAAVTLVNKETGASRATQADTAGSYQFQQAPPGTYELRVEKPGFQIVVKSGVLLQVNVPATVDVTMEVGSVGEVVNVEAEISAVNTVDASVGNAFTQTQVRQLPLQTRNVVELLSIQPGVTPTGEVLGARRDQNNVTLDGVDANDNQNSGINSTTSTLSNGSNANGIPGESGFNAALPVPLDSVQEFRVTVGGQGANLGRSSGGQVTLITKSGSNDFHGSLYEFHRNTATAANNWFSNRSGIEREALVRNQFGGSLGGRLIKDRAFFFFNYENRIDASGRAVSRNVPTESLKGGVLTFATNAGLQTLSPAEIRQIDPKGIGVNSSMLQYMSFYPAGNDNGLGADRGLNFMGLRFNAPFRQNDKAYVAKFDFNVDRSGRHVVSWRGTLADNAQDVQVAQFPGQDPAARLLNNGRGFAATYTAVVSPSVINVASVGLTRIGLEQTGTQGTSIQFDSIDPHVDYRAASRGFGRISPTWNVVDDVTWTRGTHTVNAGASMRFIKFDRSSYQNSFASYSFSRNTLQGLGSDFTNLVTNYIRQRSGNASLTLSDPASVQRAGGVLLGLINQYSATYNFEKNGQALAFGIPVNRNFATNEYEFYLQDSWRATSGLTLNYGVRYSNFSVPYEVNGTQVGTTTGVDVMFAERVGAMMAGVPNRVMPNALLSYDLIGPANGRPGWYGRDNNNWAPRFGFAYSPVKDGALASILGKGSVFRGGFAMVYDRFGSDLITEFDRTGSPGLATQVTQPSNTNFSNSERYGNALPPLPTAQGGSYPFTPPVATGGFNSGVGIDPHLVAPYSFLLNASYAREIKGLSIEVGYIGRLSRKNLVQIDAFQPLTRFKDPQSGQDWSQASAVLKDLFEGGVTPAQVAANPSMVPPQPWFENLTPGLAGEFFPGSATANYFDLVYNTYDGSHLDALEEIDRQTCLIITGCNSTFALQNAGLRTWRNAAFANFHGATLSVRRIYRNGLAFDFNYTLSHSIDNSSAAESGAGNGGAVVQDSFDYSAWRGSSDFDVRHNITANGLWDLPFGKNRMLLNSIPTWADYVIGGWQVSSIMRYRSGLPTTITAGGVYPTNYLSSAIAIPRPGSQQPSAGTTLNQNGNPAMFANTTVNGAFMAQYPGRTGTRAITRLDDFVNFDIAVAKMFPLPFEGHRLQFRAEAFNAFNNVNFFNASLRLDRPATFGEYTQAQPARVMQFALRYEF